MRCLTYSISFIPQKRVSGQSRLFSLGSPTQQCGKRCSVGTSIRSYGSTSHTFHRHTSRRCTIADRTCFLHLIKRLPDSVIPDFITLWTSRLGFLQGYSRRSWHVVSRYIITGALAGRGQLRCAYLYLYSPPISWLSYDLTGPKLVSPRVNPDLLAHHSRRLV